MNKLFLKLNRTSYIIQFLCILIVVVLFVSSKPSYVSSVTINPVLDQSTLVTETAIKLTSTYTPSYSAALYLIELADEASRKETFRKFLSENKLACVGAPKIQFYAKADNSFPVTGHFTVITVKSSCIDFVEKFVTFLSNDIDKKLIDKIQKVENKYLAHAKKALFQINEKEKNDLEVYIVNRKETLQKLIPLLTDKTEGEMFDPITFGWVLQDDMSIPTNQTVAQAELDFLSTITDLKTATRRIIARTALIEEHNIKHDFSNSSLVDISAAEPETISKTNLFLLIFFILMILGLGFVNTLLNQFKYHKNNPQ